MAIKLTSRHISNLFCEKNNGAIFIICVWFSLYHNKIIFSNQVSDSLTLTFPSVYLASIYIMCPEILWAFNQILLSLNKNDWNLNRLQRIPARITSSRPFCKQKQLPWGKGNNFYQPDDESKLWKDVIKHNVQLIFVELSPASFLELISIIMILI